jgi:hypothetical protein
MIGERPATGPLGQSEPGLAAPGRCHRAWGELRCRGRTWWRPPKRLSGTQISCGVRGTRSSSREFDGRLEMFNLFRRRPSTPAPARGAGEHWTEALLPFTTGRVAQADVRLHSMTVNHSTMPQTGNIPARVHTTIKVQGAIGSRIFCDIDIEKPDRADDSQGPAGRAFVTYTYNVATGECDIPTLCITLLDHTGTLLSVLREAFACCRKGETVPARLRAHPSWATLEPAIDSGNARFDIDHFEVFEIHGNPINPYL